MRRPIASVSILILIAAFIAGCATSPTAKWAQAREALTTAQDVLVLQHESGRVNDVDFVRIGEYFAPARAALDQAAVYLPDGGKSFEDRLSVVKAFIKQMQAQSFPQR